MAPTLAGTRVLVVGLGQSGVAAASLCVAQGAHVTVTDSRTAAALAPGLDGLPTGVVRELGGHHQGSFLHAQIIVVSPGIPEIPEIAAARAAGVPITGELELASRFIEAPLVAITGTNGKSTTTTLCGDLLATTGRPIFVGGNLGVPLAEAVGTAAATAAGLCVVEVSSFQLETVDTFRPAVAVLLNLTADHLDRHGSMEAYGAAKAKIFAAQRAADFAIINADDPWAMSLSAGIEARRLFISTSGSRPVKDSAGWVDGASLCVRIPSGDVETYASDLPGLVGRHNQENALAAIVAARLLGVTHEGAQRVLQDFRALSHRMEPVADRAGVRYFDDSKGTNVGATVAALTGFPSPVVLIAGGKDKGGSYADLARVLGQVGRAVIVIGEAAKRMEAAFTGVIPVHRAETLQDAVMQAANIARPGDAVVLSPACSSFDMFRNYEHRAQIFRTAVLSLPGASL